MEEVGRGVLWRCSLAWVAHQRLFIEVPYWLRELWSDCAGW